MHEGLKKLISDLNVSNEDFGKKLKPTVSRQTVHKWINKECVPSLLAHRDQIFLMSDYKITQNSWDEKDVIK
jgi:hypothetical protein